MAETILQHPIFTRFAFPFLLVFFLVFALLEKFKFFGDNSKQLNALISFIIGLILITAVFPVDVINNFILFLAIALVVVFVCLLIWGLAVGEAPKITHVGVKRSFFAVLILTALAVLLWATGALGPVSDWLFRQNWSGVFWTNAVFIVVIAIALAFILKSTKESS